MLPAFRSGNTSVFAWPATALPGALSWPTFSTSAASSCSSPSSIRSGAISLAMRVASCTLVTLSCLAEPFVEKDSIATRGSMPASARAESAAPSAMFASASASGSMLTAQSAKIITPSSPYALFGHSIRKQEETVLMPGLDLMICSAGRSMSPVEWIAPETRPSASPALTIITP